MKKSSLLLPLVLALGVTAHAQNTNGVTNEPNLSARTGGVTNEPNLTPRSSSGEQSLFNGKDLDGWAGNMKIWSVKDGTIVGRTDENPIHTNSFLVWTGGTVDNFELTFKYRLTPLSEKGFANSGMQYRSRVNQPSEDGPVISGYQADCEAGKTYSGILYEERGRGILAKRGEKVTIHPDPADPNKAKIEVTGSVGSADEIQASIDPKGWTDYKIIAKGNHLQQWINGKQTVDVTDEMPSKAAEEGVLALQLHAGPPMEVEFKDLKLKEIK